MSTQTILLLCVVVPFLALVLVFGGVVIVALIHARPEDVPAVVKECTGVFGRLVDRTPRLSRTDHAAPTVVHDAGTTPNTDPTLGAEDNA